MPRVESCRFYPQDSDSATEEHPQLRWVAALQNGAFVDVSVQRSANSTQHDNDTYGLEVSLTPDAARQLARDLESTAASTERLNTQTPAKGK